MSEAAVEAFEDLNGDEPKQDKGSNPSLPTP